MNKQELIKEFEEIGIHGLNVFGVEVKGIPTETAIKLIKQLDEPETGHADEAPRYLKNILARLRELPDHDREVWLKAIMSEFKQDFSHAKWREGYEQGTLEGMVEREKVKVKKFVADWIERSKQEKRTLRNALNNGGEKMRLWFLDQENYDLFARAWLDGYEVEEEKRYLVKMKGIDTNFNSLNRHRNENYWIFSSKDKNTLYQTHHTRKELEEANFGWVFDCPGIEVTEVE